ncbi:MAG: haloacid dehalogenase type II [Planctomycetota bacterium]
MPSFRPVRALSFDCYGTLIDWETGLERALAPLAARAKDDLPAQEILGRFASEEHRIQQLHPTLPYDRVLAETHRALSHAWEAPATDADHEAFAASLGTWPPFPDSRAALARLGRRFHLAILSNVTRDGIAASVSLLGMRFDTILTAEDIGSYKPDPRNFEALLRHLDRHHGIQPHELLHVAQSQFHDIVPASRLGLSTAWIDRQNLAEGGSFGATKALTALARPTWRFRSLVELADAVDAELAAAAGKPA